LKNKIYTPSVLQLAIWLGKFCYCGRISATRKVKSRTNFFLQLHPPKWTGKILFTSGA